MDDQTLTKARQRAERAVKEMEDGPLKVAAFQTILDKLLREIDVPLHAASKRPTLGQTAPSQPDSLRKRIFILKEDNYFKSQRGLREIREELGKHGWHYPLSTLSGAMQAFVRSRELRRERVAHQGRSVWMYSNP